jgi:DNA-binding XRE family transcriptional regulator
MTMSPQRQRTFACLRLVGEALELSKLAVTAVIVYFMSGSRETPGQRLWLSLYRADQYDQQAAAIVPSPADGRMDPQRATQKWLQGMSRHFKESFPEKLRQAREAARLTQQQLSQIAELSVTGLAMIERGERAPSLDTAARICWALDVASGAA